MVHSLTKFMGGHGNSIGGIIVNGANFDWSKGKFPQLTSPSPAYHGMNFFEVFGNLAFIIRARVEGLRDMGPCISPFNAFLFIQGIETLGLRMDRHLANAQAVAEHLRSAQARDLGALFRVSTPARIMRWRKNIRRAAPEPSSPSASKGGSRDGQEVRGFAEAVLAPGQRRRCRSLVIHPASTTHQQLNEEQQAAAGVSPT